MAFQPHCSCRVTFYSMRIFIHRGHKSFGPYSLDDVKHKLGDGSLKHTDMATYDGGGDQFAPLSAVPGVMGATSVGSLPGQSSPQPPKRRLRVGCCGWIVIAVVVIAIWGGILQFMESDLKTEGTTGTLTVDVQPVDRPDHLGATVAQRVYEVAKRHEELTTVIVVLKFYPTLLSDKYGHEAKGPLPMGTITVDDLAEVRRYSFDGAYMSENKGAFAEQIRRMDNAEYLTM